MKPSEKIKQILKTPDSNGMFTSETGAILDYLDANAPCEHKDAYQVESPEIYYNVCNDCGVLFMAKRD